VFVSSHVIGHKFLEDVHEDSMQFPSQINRFLCNHPDGPLKASGHPSVSRSFSIEDVRTSEQHRSDARSTYSKFYAELDFSRHCLESFCKTFGLRDNTPDATQSSRIILVSFTDAKSSDSEDRSDAQPSHSDVVLLWEELHYCGKMVTEDRPDEGKLPSGCSTVRVRIRLELGFLKPINDGSRLVICINSV